MTNKELQQNALAISEIIARSGVSWEAFQRADYDISKAMLEKQNFTTDGCLPCPFCGEYPESFNKGNEYTKKRGSVLKCNKCHYELTVCAIYQTIEWCKEKVLYNWNRRA